MATIRSDKFLYDSGAMCMTADVSDLGPNPWEQVYPDACDAGFKVVSVRTGKEVTFVVHDEARDKEGDLTHWTLKAVRNRQPHDPILDLLTVVVYND
jgi:hypothetical protein